MAVGIKYLVECIAVRIKCEKKEKKHLKKEKDLKSLAVS